MVDKRALRTRLIFAPLLLVFILGVFRLDVMMTDGYVSAALLGLLSIGAAWEYATMLRNKGFAVARGVLLLAAVCLHATHPFVDRYGYGDWLTVVTVGLTFVVSVRALAKARMQTGLEESAATLLGFLLICWPMFFGQILAMRGVNVLFYVVLVSKSGDIGGYLAGITLGKHKLIPHISPGKSVEGSLGSLVFAIVVAVMLRNELLPVDVLGAVALAILINVTTQCGDLVESLVKRRCEVKDSSNLLPEHGGVLDLIDSLLFSLPAFYFVFWRMQ